MQSQNFKKDLILKFKTISRTCFIFMIAFTIDVFMGTPTLKKMTKLELEPIVFKLDPKDRFL